MKEYHDPEVLTELYREKRMTQKEIADKLGASSATISRWLNKHGIERRKREYQKSEVLAELYHEEGMSLSDIGNKFDVSKMAIHKWVKKHDIETRKANDEKPPCYMKHSEGYRVWQHDDGEKQQIVRVHRLLAVSEFGFDAVSDKIVHHKNGCKFDNRPENIETMTSSKHTTLHNKEEDGEVSILEQIEAEFDEFEEEHIEVSE